MQSVQLFLPCSPLQFMMVPTCTEKPVCVLPVSEVSPKMPPVL